MKVMKDHRSVRAQSPASGAHSGARDYLVASVALAVVMLISGVAGRFAPEGLAQELAWVWLSCVAILFLTFSFLGICSFLAPGVDGGSVVETSLHRPDTTAPGSTPTTPSTRPRRAA